MAAKSRRSGPRIPVRHVDSRRIVVRVAVAALALAVIAFAVQGGEYGSTDLVRQKRAIARERALVDSLERSIARLEAERRAIEGDPLVQERIAREEFGMLKAGERLYRFVDSTP